MRMQVTVGKHVYFETDYTSHNWTADITIKGSEHNEASVEVTHF
jgi:hypothetical protein